MTKDSLRNQLKKIRKNIDPERRKKDAFSLRDIFLSFFSLKPNEIIAGYYPLEFEFDLKPLLFALMEQDVSIALPRITKDNNLSFALWKKNTALEKQDFCIFAPNLQETEIIPDLFLVPLIGFHRSGHRLGYGKGHYDKTLAKLRKMKDILAIGVGFSEQEIQIPFHEPHDEVLDYMLTEKELIRCR